MSLPTVKFRKLKNFIASFSSVLGINPYDPNPRPLRNPRLIIVGLLTVAQQVSVASTIYESWPNTVLITQALMSYSVGIQTATRLLNYFLRPTLANDIFMKFETLYKANETIDDSRRDLLRTKIERCRFFVKIFLYVNFIALHAPIIAALANVFLAGVMDLPLLSYIPLLDRRTLFGFGLNYFFQFLTLTFSFLGFSTYDASVIFFSFQTVPIVGLLKFKVRELQNLMQTSGQAFEANRKRFREMLAEIVELHLTYNELIRKIGEFCLIPTFVGLYVNTLGLCACMMALTQLSSGSTIILQLFLQIFIPCVMGEIITTQNKRFNSILWEFSWNELPVSEQKLFKIMLKGSQHSPSLVLPILGPLGHELLEKILNTTFSFFMFIWNFV